VRVRETFYVLLGGGEGEPGGENTSMCVFYVLETAKSEVINVCVCDLAYIYIYILCDVSVYLYCAVNVSIENCRFLPLVSMVCYESYYIYIYLHLSSLSPPHLMQDLISHDAHTHTASQILEDPPPQGWGHHLITRILYGYVLDCLRYLWHI